MPTLKAPLIELTEAEHKHPKRTDRKQTALQQRVGCNKTVLLAVRPSVIIGIVFALCLSAATADNQSLLPKEGKNNVCRAAG